MHQLDPVEVQASQWLALVDGVGPALPDIPLKVDFENGICLDGIGIQVDIASNECLLRFGIKTIGHDKLSFLPY
jgi:hypothetical protein